MLRFQNIPLTCSSNCLYNLSSKSPCEVHTQSYSEIENLDQVDLKWLGKQSRINCCFSIIWANMFTVTAEFPAPTYNMAKKVGHILIAGINSFKVESSNQFSLFSRTVPKNWKTFSHPNFNFMGCYTGQGVSFFSFLQTFFSFSVFSFFSWVHHGVPLLFCYVSFDFCHLMTHRHFRNTKA